MPKVTNTRKQRAAALLRTLETGPCLGFSGMKMSPDEARRDTQLWLRTWVIPEVKRLVPELKPKPES
jgi:hypothetical protein